MQKPIKLKRLELAGYKSISPQGQSVEFGDVTLLLGANGSGKSNLVSFFKLLNFMTTGALQAYIARQGGADSLLFFGIKTTEYIDFSLAFEEKSDAPGWMTRYEARLAYGASNRLFFERENIVYEKRDIEHPQSFALNASGFESGLADDTRATSRVVLSFLSSLRAFQFHDTSETAKIRIDGHIADHRYLRSDAGNLAAFLRRMKSDPETQPYYDRIVRHIANVMPQFGDFVLEHSSENPDYIRLNWRDREQRYVLGPHQISDGSLRFMALATLLLEPPQWLPTIIIIDEPELGLHPAAIAELAGMIKMASRHSQVVVATQAPRLVDEFHADEVRTVEFSGGSVGSVIRRLDEPALADWLARYSLSELWEKNVLGARP
jgi:predicted ATPase